MATIDMLERLRMIQRSFSRSSSLEATVATDRINGVIERTEQLIRQRAFLRDERRRLRLSNDKLARQQSDLKGMRTPGWVPPGFLLDDPSDRHLFLNVGGMMFECPISVLRRDEDSLLARLETPLSASQPDPEGVYYFDRDWWLFRYILAFLRDGSLPDDRPLLAQLYKEARFWSLWQLQRAIEEERLNLPAGGGSRGLESMSAEERQRWWRLNANSFVQRQEAAKEPAPESKDWWMDTEYNGKKFGPLSTDPAKVITEPAAPDARPMLNGTWSRLA